MRSFQRNTVVNELGLKLVKIYTKTSKTLVAKDLSSLSDIRVPLGCNFLIDVQYTIDCLIAVFPILSLMVLTLLGVHS